MRWRTELLRLLHTGNFRRQVDLVEALESEGFDVNQSSVSRELNERGVRKMSGVYQLPSASVVPAPVHDFQLTAFGCIGVIRTDPAFASVMGQFIDESDVEHVVGTVSGDDTVFVAFSEHADYSPLFALIGWRGHVPIKQPA
jgi:transcriptional regulator of arginine metabolism